MARLRLQVFWWMVTVAVSHGASGSAGDLQAYHKLDAAQRARPHDASITKAWLDKAARLAMLAADRIEHQQVSHHRGEAFRRPPARGRTRAAVHDDAVAAADRGHRRNQSEVASIRVDALAFE